MTPEARSTQRSQDASRSRAVSPPAVMPTISSGRLFPQPRGVDIHAADGALDDVEDLPHVQAVARNRLTVGDDVEKESSELAFGVDATCAGPKTLTPIGVRTVESRISSRSSASARGCRAFRARGRCRSTCAAWSPRWVPSARQAAAAKASRSRRKRTAQRARMKARGAPRVPARSAAPLRLARGTRGRRERSAHALRADASLATDSPRNSGGLRRASR